jgi:monovalent cation/hydrogen antiporter
MLLLKSWKSCDEFERHLQVLSAGGEDNNDDGAELIAHQHQYTALRRALLGEKGRTIIDLRDQGVIDDIVLRQVQAQLDAEDVRLTQQ